MAGSRFSLVDSSPASTTLVDHSVSLAVASRRSSDSTRTVPGPPFRRDRATQDRSLSISSTSISMRTAVDSRSRPSNPHPLQGGRNSPTTSTKAPATRTRTPFVYPALLSRVADAFKERITLADRLKDGLTYKEAFDGREAVDKIAYIIKTTDRNLALLLGRALDAQKFFHDVTYDHRLRDSAAELYQFRTKLNPFVSGELVTANVDLDNDDAEGKSPVQGKLDGSRAVSAVSTGHGSSDSHEKDSSPTTAGPEPRVSKGTESIDELPLPSGVFTLLTDCYSPTCTRDQLCYSIACPRRLEQQARLNMKPQPGLKKQISRESLGDFVVRTVSVTGDLLPTQLVCRNLGPSGYTRCLKKW